MEERILLIEDEEKIARFTELELVHEGYKVAKAFNGRVGLEEALSGKYDLVLLDVMLPELNGLEVLRRLRRESDVPVIMLTARDAVMDKVSGLDAGADDYITKPFEYEVVIAKIKSHLRRCYGEYAPKLNERIVELDGLKFYPERLEVKFEDKNIIITKKEGILLECLMRKYPKVVSRDYLLEKIWDDIEFVEENTLNVNVSRIRKRLNDLGIEDAVNTVRGVGYKLNKNW